MKKTRSCRRIRCIHGWNNLFRSGNTRDILRGKLSAAGCNRGNSGLGFLFRNLRKTAAGPCMLVRLLRPIAQNPIRQIARE